MYFVGLGMDCQVAYQLKRSGLRPARLPFDLAITPYTGLEKALESDFAAALDPSMLQQSDGAVIHTEYGLRFVHGFAAGLTPETLGRFQEDFGERVSNFRDVVGRGDPVTFVRRSAHENEPERLYPLLHRLFPRLTFSLLCVRPSRDGMLTVKSSARFPGLQIAQLPTSSCWRGAEGSPRFVV